MKPIEELLKHEGWANALYIAENIIKKCEPIAMLGTRGNGKTQMAVELLWRTICNYDFDMKQYHAQQRLPLIGRYVRAREIGMALRETFKSGATLSERQVLESFIAPHLLVIDECQERPDTDFEQKSLVYIMDRRYGDCKPTIMIANMNTPQFTEMMGASIVDRMKQGGGILPFKWDSFRG